MADPTTPKRVAVRPRINRSHTADASISPPTRPATAQAAIRHSHSHSSSRRVLPIHLGDLLHPHHHHHHDKDESPKDRSSGSTNTGGTGSAAGNQKLLGNYTARSRPVSAIMNDLSRITSRLPTSHDANRHSTLFNSGGGNGTGLLGEPGPLTVVPSRGSSAGNNAPARLPIRVSTGPIRPEQVAAEKARGILRAQELRSSLDSLSDLAHGGMRKLDNTYYSILEKAAMLRSTVTSLQELCAASNTLHEHFQAEAADVKEKIGARIDEFDGFTQQKTRIAELENRVTTGKKRAEDLSARLERARRQVEIIEKKEAAWQNTTAKRIKFGWACLATLCAIFIFLVLAKRFSRGHGTTDSAHAKRIKDLEISEWNGTLPKFIVNDLITATPSPSVDKAKPTLTRDVRLERFDEL